ncbi:MAG: hypothetical protein JW779_15085 [Candidatus Thorarchaeota archaeon]|nr:hypothetical protein [Candidatus Thorarchaeota archaeon]
MTESRSIEDLIVEIRFLKKWLIVVTVIVIPIAVYYGLVILQGIIISLAIIIVANPILLPTLLTLCCVAGLVYALILHDSKRNE